jgi:nitroreductase
MSLDFGSVLTGRFSCRSFRTDPVPRQRVVELMEAARSAPSAGNLQPWRFVVVTDAEHRRALAAAAFGQDFVAVAPATIVVCAVPAESARTYGARGRDLYCLQDTAAATENLLLAATAAGLGACWVGAFDEVAVQRALELEPGWRPVAMIPVGLPAEAPAARTRRPLAEVTRWIE